MLNSLCINLCRRITITAQDKKSNSLYSCTKIFHKNLYRQQ